MSAASAVLPVTIDSSVPVLPTIDLVAASDTGVSSTDNITADNTPTLSGTAEAGTVVNVFDDTTRLHTTTASADGKWNVTTAPLSEGVHSLTAQSTDKAGNTSESSLTLEVTTDTVAPDVPTIDLAASSDSGASDTDNVTNDARPTLSGTGSAGSTVKVYKGGSVVGSAVVASGGTWSFTADTLADGPHSFTAAANDTAGNTSDTSSVLDVLVDKTAPVAVYSSADRDPNLAGWYKADVTATFTVTDSGSKIQQGAELLGSVTHTATTSAEGSAVTVNSPLVIDLAGNTSLAVASDSYKIDKTAPVAVYTSADREPNAAGWYKADVTATFTVTDGGSQILQGTAPVGSVTRTATTSGEGGAVTVDSPLVTDVAGNTSLAVASDSYKIDKTAPVAVYTSADREPNAAGWYKADVTATFTVTDGGSKIQQGTELLGSVTPTATTSGEGGAVTVDSPLVTDVAGNTSVAVPSAAYKIDKTAPTVALGSSITADSSYVFGTVPAQPSCDASDGLSGLASCTVTGYSTAVGTHTLTATAKDHAGNTATASRTYTVSPWTLKGLYQPVDMSGVVNTAKAGSTIPLKFEVFQGTTELTDPATTVKSLTYISTTSTSTLPTDEIETLASGSTALRYDSTSGQFIYNWKTPDVGSYRLTITMVDGSTLQALFKLR